MGEAAREVGVASHVLRHWEDEGVLVPQRDARGHRRYSAADLAVARGVRRAQHAGLSLAQVRSFLAADEEARADLLRRHRDDLADRMRQLAAASDAVGRQLDTPADPACPYGL